MLLHVSPETRYCHERDGLCDPQDRDRARRFPEVISHEFVRKPVGGVQRHRGDPGNHCGPVSTHTVAVRSVASVPNPDHFLRGVHAAPGSRHRRRSRGVRSASRHTRSNEGDQFDGSTAAPTIAKIALAFCPSGLRRTRPIIGGIALAASFYSRSHIGSVLR